MRLTHMLLVSLLVSGGAAAVIPPFARGAPSKVDPLIARGRYLVVIGACNDCHTPQWRASDGHVPVAAWMVGSRIGLREAWGTEYPSNVRRLFRATSEAQWLLSVRTRGGKMQWHDLRHLTPADQRSIYRFIRSLGSKGVEVPEDVPPDLEPTTPYIDLRVRKPVPHTRSLQK